MVIRLEDTEYDISHDDGTFQPFLGKQFNFAISVFNRS